MCGVLTWDQSSPRAWRGFVCTSLCPTVRRRVGKMRLRLPAPRQQGRSHNPTIGGSIVELTGPPNAFIGLGFC